MKLIEFMEFMYKLTTEEQIKWNVTTNAEGIDEKMNTTIGVDGVHLTLVPETTMRIGKYTLPLTGLEAKVADKIYKFVNDYERYLDLVVEKYRKTKR